MLEAGMDNKPASRNGGKLQPAAAWKRVWDDLPALTPPRAGDPIGGLGHFRYKQRKSAENQARQLNRVFQGHPSYDPTISRHIVTVGSEQAGAFPLVWQQFKAEE